MSQRVSLIRWSLPIAIALLAHGIGAGGAFVADDLPAIALHPVVGGGGSLLELLDYNVMGDPRGEGPNTLRPLGTLLFALEWRAFGERPALFHLSSIAWFLALVVVVQVTFRRLLSPAAAMVGAALFASLAIHVEAVALIANRSEVCSLLFALLALDAAARGRAVPAVALYVIALLFKESAFLLPATAALWIAALEGPAALRLRRRGRAVAGLAVAAIAFLAARSALVSVDVSGSILAADNPLLGAEVGARLWMPWVLLGEYLQLAAAPLDLAFDHTYAAIPVDADLGRGAGWIGVAFFFILAAIGIARGRRGSAASPELRALAAAAGGFAASYALFSNSAVLIVTLFAERLFLAPSVFLVLGLVAAGQMLAPRVRHRAARVVAIAGLVAFIAVQTGLAAARTWECRDQRSLFAAQVAARPDSIKGQLYHARALAKAGEHERAIWHLGIAAAGRRAFPGPFRAPRLEALPIGERLERLPGLLAPGEPPAQFWAAYRALVIRSLGPATARAIYDAPR
jgi:hypothetical protein